MELHWILLLHPAVVVNQAIQTKEKNTVLLCFLLLLPVEGRVQAFGGLVMGGNFVLRGGLLTMRSD